MYIDGYLKIAIDLGEADSGGVFESAVSFSPSLKGTH